MLLFPRLISFRSSCCCCCWNYFAFPFSSTNSFAAPGPSHCLACRMFTLLITGVTISGVLAFVVTSWFSSHSLSFFDSALPLPPFSTNPFTTPCPSCCFTSQTPTLFATGGAISWVLTMGSPLIVTSLFCSHPYSHFVCASQIKVAYKVEVINNPSVFDKWEQNKTSVGLSWTISDCLGLSRTILVYLGLSRTIWD